MDTAPNTSGRALVALAACIALAAACLALLVPTAGAAPRTGLSATYYDDAAFRKPILNRVDARVHFNWKAGAPARRIARDTFSARWRGYVVTPRTGRYTFSARAGDGVRVWIDGRLRINRWARTAGTRESSAGVQLARGRHSIRVDYYEHTGSAAVSLLWAGPGFRKQVVPTGRLLPMAPAAPTTGQPWSDPRTWGGAVPVEGAAVTIPAGKVVTLDQDVSLANLTIKGTLLFARRDLTLEADWIIVHGALGIGTEAAPFTQRAVIRLRDRTAGEDIMGAGDKLIGVLGGTIDVHGARRTGWTRLGATAAKGANSVTLATNPGWRSGDRIAIASTDFASTQDEEATITAVSGTVLTLDRALEFTHHGTVQTIAGRQLDERAEVALLSRNVTIEGDASSTDSKFGAQVVAMDGAVVRIEGAELQRVGQLGQLRRYPIHFHMLGEDGAGSYFRGSSVHQSFNRCVTVHGTHQVLVSDNVCYDHAGHGIFLEDGAERDNVIAGNLGFGTRTPAEDERLLASDGSPATYWITNPDNVVRGNVAAGSEGHGFWIALPEHPTGLFATLYPGQSRATWNRRTALTEFSSNTAHSNGGDGLHFDRGPRPDGTVETTHHHARQDPADEDSASLVTELRGFTSFKNRGQGAWLRGTNHRMVGATLADNAIGVTFASDESFLQDSFVVGESANVGMPASWEVRSGGVGRDGRSAPRPWDADFPVRGFDFYDGRVGVERTTFANFQPWATPAGERREQGALGYHVDNDFAVHPRNFATALRFVDARPVYLESPEVGHDGDVSAVFLDTDGSVTGTAGRSVMTTNPFLYGAGCAMRAEWNVQVCAGDYATLIVGGGTTSSVRPLTVTRPDGQVQTLHGSTGDDATQVTTSVLTNTAYSVAFNGATPARTKYVLWRGRNRFVRVSVQRSPGFKVMRYGCNVGQSGSWCHGAASSLANLEATNRTGYWYDAAAGTLHLKLASVDADWDELVVE